MPRPDSPRIIRAWPWRVMATLSGEANHRRSTLNRRLIGIGIIDIEPIRRRP